MLGPKIWSEVNTNFNVLQRVLVRICEKMGQFITVFSVEDRKSNSADIQLENDPICHCLCQSTPTKDWKGSSVVGTCFCLSVSPTLGIGKSFLWGYWEHWRLRQNTIAEIKLKKALEKMIGNWQIQGFTICWTASSIAQMEVLFPTLQKQIILIFFFFRGP